MAQQNVTISWMQVVAFLVPLLLQAGGVVWWASSLSEEVINLRDDVTIIQDSQRRYRENRIGDERRTSRLEALMEAAIKSIDRLTYKLDRLEDRPSK